MTDFNKITDLMEKLDNQKREIEKLQKIIEDQKEVLQLIANKNDLPL